MGQGKWFVAAVWFAVAVLFLVLIIALTHGNLRRTEDNLDALGMTTGTP